MFSPGFLCCSAAHQSPATKAGECQRCLGCRESSQCWHSPKAGAKCHVCSGGASLGGYTELGEAQGGDAGAVQGAKSGESPLVSSWGGLGGSLVPVALLRPRLGHCPLSLCASGAWKARWETVPRRPWDLPEQRGDMSVCDLCDKHFAPRRG